MKKTKPELADGERLDDLILDGMKIFQHEKQFCFSLDAVLLGHFAFLKAKAKCVDLGTGTGVISLLLASRGAAEVKAIELNPVMAEMAARSVAYNQLEEVISVQQGDLRLVKKFLPNGAFDLVVSNPPYRPLAHGQVNVCDGLAMARHELTANLRDVVKAAKHLLKYRGRLAMVHMPERLAEIVVEMHQAGIEPKRLQLVYPKANKRPNILLIEGVVGAKPGLTAEKPLIAHAQDGSYADAILNLYGK